MSSRIRLAILGAGRIAQVHWQGYQRISDKVQIVAVVDTQKDLAARKAEEWGINRGFATLDELLDAQECDAVDICLPHNLHLECVQRACASQKHVLLEKPIARTLDEADAIINAAMANRTTLMVAHNHVFNPLVNKVKRFIDDGLIGKPHLVKALSLGWFLFTSDDFRLSKEQTGGGVFIDTGAHFIYILQHLFGEIDSVLAIQGTGARPEMEGEDNAIVSLRFSSGCLGEITTSYAARIPGWQSGFPTGWEQGFVILGDRGSIRFSLTEDKLWIYSETKSLPEEFRGWTAISVPNAYSESFHLEVEHFIDSLIQKSTPKVSGVEGRKTLQVIDAAYRSVDTGRLIKIEAA